MDLACICKSLILLIALPTALLSKVIALPTLYAPPQGSFSVNHGTRWNKTACHQYFRFLVDSTAGSCKIFNVFLSHCLPTLCKHRRHCQNSFDLKPFVMATGGCLPWTFTCDQVYTFTVRLNFQSCYDFLHPPRTGSLICEQH